MEAACAGDEDAGCGGGGGEGEVEREEGEAGFYGSEVPDAEEVEGYVVETEVKLSRSQYNKVQGCMVRKPTRNPCRSVQVIAPAADKLL